MTSAEFKVAANIIQWSGSFLIAILAFAKLKNIQKHVLIIGIYGLNSVVFQGIQTGAYVLAKVHPNPAGNFYVLTETILLLWLFANAFNRKSFTRFIIAIGVIYTLLFMWDALPNLTVIHANIRTFRDLIMIVASMLYFLLLLEDLPRHNLNDLPMFWINAAILFFFSSTFILSLTTTYLVKTLGDQYAYLWIFRNLLRGFFCLIICVGIWKSYKFRSEVLK